MRFRTHRCDSCHIRLSAQTLALGPGEFMGCTRCSSDSLKPLDAEVAIHLPGWEGLEKPLVLVFPKLTVCLACGFVEFALPAAQLEQLKDNDFPAQSQKTA